MKLYPYQKTAVKFLKQNQKAFIEAPTGSGKSIMIAYLANYYANQGKKVIVSTNTNQLALQLLNTIQSNKIEDVSASNKAIDIAVGKNNYLNLSKINLELFSNFTNPKDIIKELNNIADSNNNTDYFIDIFLNKLDLGEDEKELLSKLLINNDKDDIDYIKDFEDLDISVTNHYYLIYKIFFTKESYKDYIFIIDEAHQINEAMEAIFTNSFSLFRFKFSLDKLIQKIQFLEFRGSKTLIKQLQKLSVLVNNLFKVTCNNKLTGLSFINDEQQRQVIYKIIKHLTKKEVIAIKQKLQKTNITLDDNKLKTLFWEEWQELIEISEVELKNIGIYYSPEKGYPRLSSTKSDYYNSLKGFWNKLDKIKAFSATFTIPDNEDYYIKRLNLPFKPSFYNIDAIFSHEQIDYFIVKNDFPAPKSTESSVDIEWIKVIGQKVKETFDNKNSLILMGAFLEVDTLYDYLQTLNLSVPIFKAERKKSTYRIVEKFKNNGGILIATRNYGTGLDLKGGLLERLYITKLPYPVLGNKKWLDLLARDKSRNTNIGYFLMVNEMLLNLKQWAGRLIRTKEDKGKLYILDSRVDKSQIKSKVEKLLKNMFR